METTSCRCFRPIFRQLELRFSYLQLVFAGGSTLSLFTVNITRSFVDVTSSQLVNAQSTSQSVNIVLMRSPNVSVYGMLNLQGSATNISVSIVECGVVAADTLFTFQAD